MDLFDNYENLLFHQAIQRLESVGINTIDEDFPLCLSEVLFMNEALNAEALIEVE